MDVQFSPEHESFRRTLAEWLESALIPEWRLSSSFWRDATEAEQVEALRSWQVRLFEAGWAGLSWPREFGGRGAGLVEQAIYAEELARAEAPEPLGWVGIDLIGPTIIQHGRDDQRSRFLPPILNGQEIWCQGFSEPDAGSDLASLKTRAVLDERRDEFIVTGQKTWCSWADVSDWCMLLVRTNSQEPRHRGVSALIVDMRSPGVSVRPLRQITGRVGFNEVFFDDVRVPRANLLGSLHDGWKVAMTTLAQARGVLGLKNQAAYHTALHQLASLAGSTSSHGAPILRDPRFRSRYADAFIHTEIVRLNAYRSLSRRVAGEDVGFAASVEKLHFSRVEQEVHRLVLETLGPDLAAVPETADGAYPRGGVHDRYFYALAGTIYGGTTEIQKNIIAERILGLPRE